MNSDSHVRVPQLLQNLIIHFLPPNTKEDVIQKYLSYFTRILSSRLTANSSQDEGSLHMSIQKQIISTYENQNVNNHTANAALSRNQELLQKFSRVRHITNKYNILYVLLKLSEFNNNGSGSLLDLTKKNGARSSGIEAIFKSKEIERMNRSLNTTSASAMEVESNMTSTMFSTAKKEKESQLIQTLKVVTNKGNSTLNLTETDLIRDLLFVFQGINGHAMALNEREDCFQLRSSIPVPEPSRKIINSLCELGWLFKKTTDFLEKPCQGQIRQSLNIAVKEELNEYYRLLAVLENIRSKQVEDEPGQGGSQGLTLRKLALWTIEPLERLKWLCVISESVAPLFGGNVISSIYAYKFQGSPATQALVSRILNQVLQPFLKFVKDWVYLGELNDKSAEFFIQEDKGVDDKDLWRKKYKIIGESIPSFIDQDIAEMIMTAGKSVNFLKKCCDVKDWILDIPPFEIGSMLNCDSTEKGRNLLKDWIMEATKRTNAKLVNVIFVKFQFLQNMESIKKYLLMGQGDFIQNLMDQLSNELAKKANLIHRHNLLSFLETAIRSSNAQYHHPDSLARLDVKLLEPSLGDSGWDIFSLNYNVFSPLNCILHEDNMKSYLRIFNILWRVKRVEYTLSNVWIQHSSRMLSKIKGMRVEFNKCFLLRNEMIHFISNLFNYIMVEVIESSWRNFVEEVNRAQDLSEIIRVHDNFLNSVLDRALLTPKYEPLSKQMMRIFDMIFQFKFSQEMLINTAAEEYKRETSLKNKREMIELIGRSIDDYGPEDGYLSQNRGTGNYRISPESLKNLESIRNDYRQAFHDFRELLDKEDKSGKLRFLIFRLDFNEYYTKKKHLGTGEKFEKMDKFSRINNMFTGFSTGNAENNAIGIERGSPLFESNEFNYLFDKKREGVASNTLGIMKDTAKKSQKIEIEAFLEKSQSQKKNEPPKMMKIETRKSGDFQTKPNNNLLYDHIFKKEMEEEKDEFLQPGEDNNYDEEEDEDYGQQDEDDNEDHDHGGNYSDQD